MGVAGFGILGCNWQLSLNNLTTALLVWIVRSLFREGKNGNGVSMPKEDPAVAEFSDEGLVLGVWW